MGRSWPFLSGCRMAERRDYHYYRQLSYYYPFPSSITHTTYKPDRETDRQETLTRTIPTTWGAFRTEGRRGHGTARFFLVLVHQPGVDTHHTSYPFSLVMAATDENSSYHTTSIPRIFVRCCTSPS